jgi:hypothetical protein
MSLSQWADRCGIPPTRGSNGSTCVIMRGSRAGLLALWSLSDHAVSSICGDVVWLVPRSGVETDE